MPQDSQSHPDLAVGRLRRAWRTVQITTLAVALTATGTAMGVSPSTAAPVAADRAAPTESLTGLVNPFIGTQDDGNTYPGATVPFGMVQFSPDNGHNVGYDYGRDRIRGFSLVHLSGVGCGLGGLMPMLPTTGTPTQTRYEDYALPYGHDGEEAAPGYYRVGLAAPAGTIDAELTATEHTGIARYTFPETTEATVLLNPGQALNRVTASTTRIVDARTVETAITSRGFCQDTQPFTVHTRTTFDRDIASSGTWIGDTLAPGSAVAEGERTGAWVTFDATQDRDVEVVTSLSYVDAAGAAANHDAQATTFDDARASADTVWEDRLDDVAVPTTDVTQARVFYSALYRSFLAPNTGTDVDGRYRGWDTAVHEAEDFTYYQNFSLWDTYRTQQQLLYLLAPEESRDMALSVVRAGEQLGWLPRWGYGPVETNVMTGDPGTAFLVSAWSQGLLAGHEEEAYAVLAHNADNTPDATSVANGRAGNPVYLDKGFVPHEPGENGRPGDYDLHHGGSATLEYALSDALLSTMARGLGHDDDAARYAARGENYLALYDPTTQSFRARDRSGFFVGDPDPAQAVGFHEGTAVQYEWLVQQDLPGLIELFGGTEAAAERLDDFFVYDELLLDPERTARELWVNGTYSYYGQDTYNPNNEPDLHAPYVYQWVGQPHKTADVVAAAMTLFTDGPTGVTGNDDLGTMSAWYVLSAIGAYPIVPGTDVWGLSTPSFESVDLTLDPAWFGTDSLAIRAPGVGEENRYVQSVTATGPAGDVTASHLSGTDLTSAGTLTFEVGPTPSTWATGPDAAPGSLVERGELDTRLMARAAPALAAVEAGGTTTISVDVIAQADAVVSGTIEVTGSDVVTADTTSLRWSIDSGGVPVSQSFPVTLGVRDGVVAGTYPITITVSDGAGQLVDAVTSVTVAESTWLTDHFDNTGIGDAGEGNANFDGLGYYLLRDALADLGFVQGAAGSVTASSQTYVVPPVEPGEPDNVLAAGQVLEVPDAYRQARTVSLVGATNNGTPHGGGEMLLTFTDGTTSAAVVELSDWCTGSPAAGNVVVAKAGQRGNGTNAAQNIGCGLYATAPVEVPEGRTLASLTLPQAPNVHVFTVAFDVTAPVIPTVTATLSPEQPVVGTTAQVVAALEPGDVAGDLVLLRVTDTGSTVEVTRTAAVDGGATFPVEVTAAAVRHRVAFVPADATLAAPAVTVQDLVVQGRETPVDPSAFVDVPEGMLFFEEIRWLFENGISTGWETEDGREYRPLTPIARDAMAAFLYRQANSPAFNAPTVSPFSDVSTDNQFYKEIAWLAEEDISTGWDNGDGTFSFRPLEPIGRDAMAAFLYRMADEPAFDAPSTSPFTDITPATQFYTEITWLVSEGISTGWLGNDGTAIYRPTTPINRDAMAAFLHRYDDAGFSNVGD